MTKFFRTGKVGFRTALVSAAAIAGACATLAPIASATPIRAEAALRGAKGFNAQAAPFAITVDGEAVPYARFFAVVSPGEALAIDLPQGASNAAYSLVSAEGDTSTFANGRASWRAPDAPGQSRELKVKREDGKEVALSVFVLEPAANLKDGYLNGFRIGEYPDEPLRGLEVYNPPAGFIAVTQENMNMKVSPHFRLGQFLCKQQADHWPKYVLLEPRLIMKLEALMADVNAQGIETEEFFVMSGYRTPWYNAAIGNTTTYSQHVYGGAADVYVDVAPRDGDMDDLNGDGAVTKTDAVWLYDRAEAVEHSAQHRHLIGGLGIYDRNSVHGPFLHVDSRGYEARW